MWAVLAHGMLFLPTTQETSRLYLLLHTSEQTRDSTLPSFSPTAATASRGERSYPSLRPCGSATPRERASQLCKEALGLGVKEERRREGQAETHED